jgi:hypothetical protein
MTTSPTGRRRSLQDDLLDDLRQGPAAVPGPPAPVEDRARPAAPEARAGAEPAPALELRITPRSWSAVRWSRHAGGDGVTISLGPVNLSLAGLRS